MTLCNKVFLPSSFFVVIPTIALLLIREKQCLILSFVFYFRFVIIVHVSDCEVHLSYLFGYYSMIYVICGMSLPY